MNANEALARNYMTIKVEIRSWQMNVKDKEVTNQVTADAGAADGSMRVYKSIGNHKAAKAVKSAYTNIQRVWRNNTLPLYSGEGRTSGARIAPTNDVIRVMKEIEHAKVQAEQALDEFRLEYPQVIAWAQNELKHAFDASDFPSVDDACARFYSKARYNTIPVSTSLDDMNVPGALVSWMKDEIEKENEAEINNALNSLREKLLEEVKRMADNLAKYAGYAPEYNDEGKLSTRAPQLYDSLVTNVQHSLTMLRATAVGDTTKLTELADKIDQKLVQYPVESLKNDPGLARKVSEAAKEISDAIDDDNWSF